jgi:hypothetical protein
MRDRKYQYIGHFRFTFLKERKKVDRRAEGRRKEGGRKAEGRRKEGGRKAE